LKRLLLVLLLSTSTLTTIYAQSPQRLDSLLAVSATGLADTNKVLLLAETAFEYSKVDPDKSREYATQALQLAEACKYDYGLIKTNNLMGRSYALQNNLPMALRYYNKALSIARRQNNPARIGVLAVAIGAIYTQNKNWEKAREHLQLSKEAFEKAGMPYPASLMINMGYYYSAKRQFAEALDWELKGMEAEEKKATPTVELAQLYGNAGGNLVKLEQYPRALQYLHKAIRLNTEMGNTNSLAFNYCGIGSAYSHAYDVKQRMPDSLRDGSLLLNKATHYLTASLELSHKLGLRENKMETLEQLAYTAERRQDYMQAYIWYTAFTKLKDSLTDLNVQRGIANAEAEHRVQHTTDSLRLATTRKDNEIAQNKLQRNAALAIIIMAGITGFMFVNRQKLKHRSRLITVEADRKRAEDLARTQLAEFTRGMQEKNELIEQFTARIEKYRTDTADALAQTTSHNYFEELKQSVIITEDQWTEFRVLFEKVHPGYIARVRDKFADITSAEMRFVLLTKLGLNNREMATMLGVTPDAVRVAKYRLLKKIQLPDGANAEDFLNGI